MKTILITGSSRGIGYHISSFLLDQGYKVIGAARGNQEINHPHFIPLKLDLLQAHKIKPKVDELIKKYPEIDGLILNAGIGFFGHLEQLSEKQLYDTMQVNFISHAMICKYFIKHLKEKDRSDIIFIGSEASLNGSKAGSFYCASKFALRGFAKSLKQECSKSGVRISMIHPGMVKTSFHDRCYFKPGPDKTNVILPEDVAKIVLTILNAAPYMSFDEISLNPLNKVISFR